MPRFPVHAMTGPVTDSRSGTAGALSPAGSLTPAVCVSRSLMVTAPSASLTPVR